MNREVEYIKYLKDGHQLSNGAQFIYQIKDDEYFLSCDDGCCDTYMNEAEVINYIECADCFYVSPKLDKGKAIEDNNANQP